MKKIILLLFAPLALSASTNIFPTLTTASGVTFTNAKISSVTAGVATILHVGGGKKISLAELPAEIQKQYNYDPARAQAEADAIAIKTTEAAARARQAAAQRFASESALGEQQMIVISDAMTSAGYTKCETDAGTILMKGLPSNITSHFTELKKLDSFVAGEIERVNKLIAEANLAKDLAPSYASGSPQFVAAAQARMDRAALLTSNAEKESDKVEATKSKLLQMRSESVFLGRIIAAKTAQKYSGLEVWQYVGKATGNKLATTNSE